MYFSIHVNGDDGVDEGDYMQWYWKITRQVVRRPEDDTKPSMATEDIDEPQPCKDVTNVNDSQPCHVTIEVNMRQVKGPSSQLIR
ncbi:hypothetical protein DKX38_021555 [Salix brachista]|uniref:Uncharacterized protein n=1 Tax=Salix brachista TaxID=2182728 RepID=A0A5N5K836_9ROSI|nr:hypothetical protein DKX38_021555 [Salix brachista]